MFSGDAVRRILPVGEFGTALEFHRSIGSTNDRGKELARQGGKHGTLIVAEEQTAGRGRAGRRWITRAGAALAFSVLLRPRGLPAELLSRLSGTGSLAVACALEEEGGQPQLKWPNDVLLRGRKVAGILAEAAWEGGEPVGVVLGIGVNALSGSAPPDSEVDFPAVSVEDALGKPVDRIRLLARILHHLHRWYQDLDSPGLIAAWQSHLSYRDETVVVQDGERVLRGILRGLGPTGCLILEVPERGRVEVLSGQLGLRPIDSPEESATLEGGEEPDVRQPS